MDNKDLELENNIEKNENTDTTNEVVNEQDKTINIDNTSSNTVAPPPVVSEPDTTINVDNDSSNTIAPPPVVSEQSIQAAPVAPTNNTSSKYNSTVLLSYLLGMLGIHRIINGKKISGVTMLLTSVLVLPIFAGLLFLGLDKDITALIVIGMFYFPIMLTVGITALVDFIMIICGLFKNSDKVAVKSNKPFFKNWVHYLIIGFIVYNLIASIVLGAFFGDDAIDKLDELLADSNDVVEEQDVDEKDKKPAKSSSDSLEALDYCLTGNGNDDIKFDTYEELTEPLLEHFEDLGYDVYEDDGYLSFTKEEGNAEIDFSVLVEEKKGVVFIDLCSVEVFEEKDDVYYRMSLMNSGYTSYDEEFEYDISANSYVEDDEFSYYGTYYSESDEYYADEFDDESEYDFDKDERGFIAIFERFFSTIEDELDDVLDY